MNDHSRSDRRFSACIFEHKDCRFDQSANCLDCFHSWGGFLIQQSFRVVQAFPHDFIPRFVHFAYLSFFLRRVGLVSRRDVFLFFHTIRFLICRRAGVGGAAADLWIAPAFRSWYNQKGKEVLQ